MAYIGKEPVNGFHTRQSLTTNGSTTTFTLDFTIASSTSIIVLVGGVVQEPDVAYTLSGGGTSIVFSTAPSSSQTAYIHYLGQAIVQNLLDVNGAELVLDVDADTTIHADTDDEIDFRIGGSDVITFKTTGIHLPDGEKYFSGTGDDVQLFHDGTNSFLTNSTGILKVATETSGIAVTIGHTTSEVTFGDNVTVTGNLTIGGTTNFGDFDISNVGSIALDTITNDGTDITLDSSGDIILDAAGNDIFFKAGGTTIGEITNSSSDLVIKSSVSDKDILIKGNDGGSAVTALTLDMSAAGAATFNSTVTTTGLVLGSTAVTSTPAELNLIDGGATIGTTAVADADGILHNDGGAMKVTSAATFKTYFQEGISQAYDDFTIGDAAVLITTSSGNITIDAAANDSDIIFKGTDGGSDTTFLTIDGSAAGAATFNDNVIITDGKLVLGSTAVTSTAAELNVNDGVTLGTAIASKVVTTDANIDTTGQRNLTISGELDAATLDISGAIDVAGTSNLDVVDIDGAVDMASTLQVDGVATFTAVPVFPNNTIETADIQADAITAAKIADNAVVTAGINADAVTGAEIADDAINSEHYTDGSIDTAHIAADQITNAKIADDQIDSEHYVDGSIDTAHIAADQITNAKIADDQIDSEHYVDGSIDTAHLADGQITIAKLATAVLTGATDIGADLVDADLFLVDDGAGGTLRKTTAERIKTYIGGGTSWQAIKTGAYTAVAGQGVFANTTSSAFTVTLPASPALGDEVTVVDYAGTFDSNACTIGRNSQPIQGVAEDLVVSTERASFTLVYVDGTQGWLFKND